MIRNSPRRLIALGLWLVAGLLLLGGLAAVAVLVLLRASLPSLDGTVQVSGPSETISIERDPLGIPTIVASNRLDMVYGIGFVHGQDRFFQMDLNRRFSAGELAALIGVPALGQDQFMRQGRFRRVAQQALANLPDDQRALLDAFAQGVNAGLASLAARPPEYWLLRTKPTPWLPEDTLLTALAMAMNLTPPPLDRLDTLLRRAIGSEAFDFFYPRGTDWDAALDRSVIPPAPIPGPERIDFRRGWELKTAVALPVRQHGTDAIPSLRFLAGHAGARSVPEVDLGSNGWAVDGTVCSNGASLVASDMHLAYSMPGPLYRVRLLWSESGRSHDVVGLTLPGTPALVAGSNGKVAWAPTAAELDYVDAIALELNPDDPDQYRVPEGWAHFESVVERIEVRGGAPVECTIRWTIWGPVIGQTGRGTPVTFDGRPVVDNYTFRSPEAVDLRFFDLMLATNRDQALRIAVESGSPVVNLMVGDHQGNVGWTIAGRLPLRFGRAGPEIVSWATGSNGWHGWLSPDAYPRVTSPAVKHVFSGNHRKLGSESYQSLARSAQPLGARARQIRDSLDGLTNATEADMWAIQLDNRALLLEPWRELLLATLQLTNAPSYVTNGLDEVVAHLRKWHGRASPDSVGYRLLLGIRVAVIDYIFEPLTAKTTALLGEELDRCWDGAERPVWALLKERPPHLLSPRFSSYDDLLLTAIRGVVSDLRRENQGDLSRATWGRLSNRPVHHPFSGFLPMLSGWLDASTEGCAGGHDMPRIHNGFHGSVNRLVVSPGHEDRGLLHIIGGQSGHFLSAYYRAGHEAWVLGKPTPLRPGPRQHTLKLVPSKHE